ncbi:MAG: M20 family metallopeptidase [Simkaniaceae bacterium]|nr:M20 family metallopeptidase [Simkaniaceae bacterium]
MSDLESYTIDIRRKLHEIPELSWEEEKTLELIHSEIEKILSQSPFDHSIEVKKGGIVVDINIDPKLPRRLLRADCDALPIEEKTHLPYSSKNPGVMHACGHDCHSAMLLGALKGLSKPKYNLRFVWQRAEEQCFPMSGGCTLVKKENLLDGVDEVYGLHIISNYQKGTFYSAPTKLMANSGFFEMRIETAGGHVMNPHIEANAIDVSVDIHTALRGLPVRVLGPIEQVSFVPTISKAGQTANIRPSSVDLCYSFRNFSDHDNRKKFVHALQERVENIINGYSNAKLTKFEFIEGYPPVINDPESYEKVNEALLKAGYKTELQSPLFCGEDFAYYLEKRPGAFWLLGAKQGEGWDHHTPLFNPDESAMIHGVNYWLSLSSD